jgi:CheY-like chemotaxis protein/anti-sigma regulatory factor (Ser/Thr protein kinase)
MLRQGRLARARRMECLGGLAGAATHDLNNALGAILGLASASVEVQPPGSPARQAFATIVKAAERGGALVKGLVEFSRKSRPEPRELDVNALLRALPGLLEPAALARVRLELDLAADLRPVSADASTLAGALAELAANALEALPEGGVLNLRSRNQEPDQVEILVQDDGPGMTPELLAKALEPLFSTRPAGAGLGLPLAQAAARNLGGQLDLQSEPGHGTRARLRLPALAVAAPAPPKPESQALTVLLVDDDELILDSIGMLLESLGHTVLPAPSGETALERLRQVQPDVVILDMNMPGLGGRGTLPRLRELNPAVPVLLATGRADQAALDLVAGFRGVSLLSKPFTKKELQERLVVVRG